MTRATITRPKSTDREINKMLKAAWKAGWKPRSNKINGHAKMCSPCGKHMVTVPMTPSDHRSVKNTRAEFKRKGLRV